MRVLVAEDEIVARRTLEALLPGWGYEVHAVTDGRAAWAALRGDDAPRMAVLDWTMPGMDGLDVCRLVRDLPGGRYVYVLLLTARDAKEDIVQGLDAGADDYLVKPFNPSELEVRLRAGRRILELQSDLLATQEALRDQASHDAQTSVWNRATILTLVRRELANARRERLPLTVLLGEIDGFEQLEGSLGAETVSTALRVAAITLQTKIREHDAVGRLQGPLFLVVAPGCDAETSAEVAERLRATVEDLEIPTSLGPVSMTISLGLAATDQAPPNAGRKVLVQAAGLALHRAKAGGGNRVVRATEADF